MDTNKQIGANLKMVREYAEVTQDAVAAALGITRSAYANYEIGFRPIPYEALQTFASMMGCEPRLFYEDSTAARDEMLATAFKQDGYTPEDQQDIIRFKKIVMSYIKMDKLENEDNGTDND